MKDPDFFLGNDEDQKYAVDEDGVKMEVVEMMEDDSDGLIRLSIGTSNQATTSRASNFVQIVPNLIEQDLPYGTEPEVKTEVELEDK